MQYKPSPHLSTIAPRKPLALCLTSEMQSEFLLAVANGDLPRVQRLLREGNATVTETDEDGESALWIAIACSKFPTAQWLVEYGGADMSILVGGANLWDLLVIVGCKWGPDAAATAFLRAMLLRADAPVGLSSWHTLHVNWRELVREGVRLRARLPAYLAQRRALLDENCLLIAPLCALVSDYEVPTTTDELWATGLGLD
jgi:hypothetical protein